MPAFTMTHYLNQSIGVSHRMQHYFQELRSLDRYDAEDGKLLGLRLIYLYREKKNKKHLHRHFYPDGKNHDLVSEFVRSHRGLAELSAKYPWITAFLGGVCTKKLVLVTSISTRLDWLSANEVLKIAANLSPALRQRKTPEAGLYQWKNQNPAMIELFEEHPWFESLLLIVSTEILKTAPWGVVWRVVTGAVLSIIDMASDINVIVLYLGREESRHYGWSLFSMLMMSLLLQLLAAVVHHRTVFTKAAIVDCGIIVIGMKPALNAYYVATNKPQTEGMRFDAKMELVVTKVIEMVAESVPGESSERHTHTLADGPHFERVARNGRLRAKCLRASCANYEERGEERAAQSNFFPLPLSFPLHKLTNPPYPTQGASCNHMLT